MEESLRFKLVFTKLRAALEEDAGKESAKIKVEIHRPFVMSREELEEIDSFRRIVLEVTESELISFTTT